MISFQLSSRRPAALRAGLSFLPFGSGSNGSLGGFRRRDPVIDVISPVEQSTDRNPGRGLANAFDGSQSIESKFEQLIQGRDALSMKATIQIGGTPGTGDTTLGGNFSASKRQAPDCQDRGIKPLSPFSADQVVLRGGESLVHVVSPLSKSRLARVDESSSIPTRRTIVGAA